MTDFAPRTTTLHPDAREPGAASAREHSLDAARGTMMILGVLLHTAWVYGISGRWLVRDPNAMAGFDELAMALGAFRMPAFFWISGYFTAMVLSRRGTPGLMHRLQRIALPLFFTWLTMNSLHEWFVAWQQGKPYRWQPPEIYHLWFLVNLFVYNLLAWALLPALKTMVDGGGLAPLAASRWRLCLLLGLASFGAHALARLLAASARGSVWQLLPLEGWGHYSVFFLGGCWMWLDAAARRRFMSGSPLWLLPAVVVSAWLIERLGEPERWSLWQGEAMLLVSFVTRWLCVAAVLGLFARLFPTPSRLTRMLSDSSYTIYLFHHLMVVVVATLLLGWSVPAVVKFGVVVLVVVGSTMLLHRAVVRPSRWLSLLFNGQGGGRAAAPVR